MPSKGLIERLANGEKILIAEGYLMEIERRGYLQCGGFVPEVVLENPDVVRNLHREFVHAGSDVVEAFTYYGHREKLRTVGREDDLERLNRTALKIAREVADETGTLMAGNLCNSNLYDKDNREADDKIKAMLKEQVEWAVEEGADYIIAETISNYGEAKMVLEAVKKYGHGLPLVITMSIYEPDMTMDGLPITEALRKLEEAGAVVVGLNCGRGPKTMLPTIREIRKVCKGPIAALPVTFRTTETCRTWIALKDTETGLRERLNNGENILVAEGYMYETERRGYLKFGSFAPEVVLDNPDMVRSMHREFVHAGSDVVEAFTYYSHRERLKLIGREESLEKLNRTALRIAREVADETGTLMAGGLCSTTIYEENQPEIDDKIRAMFKEQVDWAFEEGADLILAETLNDYAEAKLALDAILQYGKGLPAVITIVCYNPDKTLDDVPIAEACRRLEEGGAAVVGVNCGRGPVTMLPLIREIRKTCKGPIAALSVAFRTTEEDHSWTSLKDPTTGKHAWPANLSCMACSREDVRQFAEEAKAIGVNYVGLCCGNAPFYFREVAEVYGRKPGACKYSPDMSLSVLAGDSKDSYSKLRVYAGTGKK